MMEATKIPSIGPRKVHEPKFGLFTQYLETVCVSGRQFNLMMKYSHSHKRRFQEVV